VSRTSVPTKAAPASPRGRAPGSSASYRLCSSRPGS
jgi:hypothetical protein